MLAGYTKLKVDPAGVEPASRDTLSKDIYMLSQLCVTNWQCYPHT